jgi:glycosyltransferase A (GT-A) superfamily protein (DUF2064 family)
MTMRVAAVVPVIEERDAIGAVVLGLRAAGACCVFVVDGGSRDDTRTVAAAAGAIIVDEPRRGYGRACRTGADRALAANRDEHADDEHADDEHAHDAVAFLDGDGSCDPADLPALTDALAGVDIVLGWRPRRLTDRGAMPVHAWLGNQLVAAIVAARSGGTVHDLPPFKIVRRATLERLALDDDGYGWTAQLVARSLTEPSIRVREIPVAFRNRRGGTSKVSGSLRASARAGRVMLSVAMRETRGRPVIALMAKAPGAGHAKTRLAVELGNERTADLWIACLADVADAAREAAVAGGAQPIAMLARPADAEPVSRIVGPGWMPLVQDREGLPAALSAVFLAAFDRGADRAVAVAGDVPSLPPARIRAALDALDRSPRSAALGPSGDGGYHLVGLRWPPAPRWWPGPFRRRRRSRLTRRLETVFGRVRLGDGSALDATMEALRSADWRVTFVPSWPDVDTIADLRALARRLADDGCWAPRTTAWVERHRAAFDRGPVVHDSQPVGGSSTQQQEEAHA